LPIGQRHVHSQRNILAVMRLIVDEADSLNLFQVIEVIDFLGGIAGKSALRGGRR
jgi:hypothetical protein